jgi:uncharacterized integral membrane protein (TIGR00698 family)
MAAPDDVVRAADHGEPSEPRPLDRSFLARVGGRAPGLLAALGLAAVAMVIGAEVPVVGGPVLAIVLGALLAALLRPGDRWRPGLSFAARPVLQASIVVLGATLSLRQVADVGWSSLPVMLATLVVALVGAWAFGRAFGTDRDTAILVGVGTAICGASAIAAVQSTLRARESVVAYAIGTIFVCNIAAVLVFPPLGHLLGLDPRAFGLWAGTAINDTSSVVAAAYSYGGDAGPHAVVVKLTRSLMIVPIVVAIGWWVARRGDQAVRHRRRGLRGPVWTRLMPLFIVGFIAASALTTIGAIPVSWHPTLTSVGAFLITTALAGIGLSLRLGDLRRAGVRPLALGTCLWFLVAASSLGAQALTGSL